MFSLRGEAHEDDASEIREATPDYHYAAQTQLVRSLKRYKVVRLLR